jgi:hypothetical protein
VPASKRLAAQMKDSARNLWNGKSMTFGRQAAQFRASEVADGVRDMIRNIVIDDRKGSCGALEIGVGGVQGRIFCTTRKPRDPHMIAERSAGSSALG